MRFSDMKCKKTTCEKYSLRFNNGWDWANFMIDESGLMQCNSSFGNYSYQWGAFGESFKKFLCGIDSSYLLNKVSDNNYFDVNKYQKQAKKALIALRKENEITSEQARELYEFIENGLDDCGSSYDLVCGEIYDNALLSKVCNGDVMYSDFSPEQDYPPNAVAFANEIFPMFVNILKEELETQRTA